MRETDVGGESEKERRGGKKRIRCGMQTQMSDRPTSVDARKISCKATRKVPSRQRTSSNDSRVPKQAKVGDDAGDPFEWAEGADRFQG